MGSSSRPAASVQTQVRQEYPAFFQPHLEQVLRGAEEQFQRPYQPFPQARLVETPAARTEALTALQEEDLARMSQPAYEAALAGTQQAAKSFPELDISSYMNPYQQLVTDQLLRKAGERRGVERKRISDAAARAGAFGGSRHGVTEGMFDEATQEQLQDIQDRADMSNFQNALAAAQADRASGLSAAAQQAQIGQAQQQALTQGLVGREKAATAEQALGQQIRDIGFQEFMEQQEFPKQKLSEYSAIIRGHTPPTNQWQTKDVQQAYSPLQAGIGTAGMLGGLAKGFGLMSKEGGSIPYSKGGGLSSVLRFQDQGSVEEVEVASLSTPIQERASDLQHQQAEALKRQQLANYAEKADAYRSLVETPLDLNQILSDLGIERSTYNERESYDKAVRGVPQRGRYDKSTVGTAIDELLDYGKFGKREGPYDEFKSRDVETLEGPEAVKDLAADIIKPRTLKSPRFMLPHLRKGLRQLMNNKGGPVRMAYGGVPGQAYTEDIGMVGGLGAVAGPQMRFAYGGVPGQAYTEDIGMTGGLAAVAGPQLRFADRGRVPKSGHPLGASMWGDIYGESTISPGTLDRPGRRVIGSDVSGMLGEFLRDKWRKLGSGAKRLAGDPPEGVKGLGVGLPTDTPVKPKLLPPRAIQVAQSHKAALDKRAGIDDKIERMKGNQHWVGEDKKEEEEDELSELLQGIKGMKAGRLDSGEFEMDESVSFEEKSKPKGKEVIEKDKVSVTEKPATMGYKEMLAYFTPLMTGSDKGAIAAGRHIAGMKGADTALDKKLKQSLIDYRKAGSKTARNKEKNQFIKTIFEQRMKTDEFRLKMAEFANKVADQDQTFALNAWKQLTQMDKMAAIGLLGLDEDEREDLMKDPGAYIGRIKEGIQSFSRRNPSRSATQGSNLSDDPSRFSLERKAVGGTIPNSFNKLGISSIRRV